MGTLRLHPGAVSTFQYSDSPGAFSPAVIVGSAPQWADGDDGTYGTATAPKDWVFTGPAATIDPFMGVALMVTIRVRYSTAFPDGVGAGGRQFTMELRDPDLMASTDTPVLAVQFDGADGDAPPNDDATHEVDYVLAGSDPRFSAVASALADGAVINFWALSDPIRDSTVTIYEVWVDVVYREVTTAHHGSHVARFVAEPDADETSLMLRGQQRDAYAVPPKPLGLKPPTVSVQAQLAAEDQKWCQVHAQWYRWDGTDLVALSRDLISRGYEFGGVPEYTEVNVVAEADEDATHWRPVFLFSLTDPRDVVTPLPGGSEVYVDCEFVPDNGKRVIEYLDGDQPGGRWEGEPMESSSVFADPSEDEQAPEPEPGAQIVIEADYVRHFNPDTGFGPDLTPNPYTDDDDGTYAVSRLDSGAEVQTVPWAWATPQVLPFTPATVTLHLRMEDAGVDPADHVEAGITSEDLSVYIITSPDDGSYFRWNITGTYAEYSATAPIADPVAFAARLLDGTLRWFVSHVSGGGFVVDSYTRVSKSWLVVSSA